MPGTYRIKLTAAATADLEGIFDYIQKDSRENAAKFIGKILAEIDELYTMPLRFKFYCLSRKKK
jgi:plasmid stabilization system protein ParE